MSWERGPANGDVRTRGEGGGGGRKRKEKGQKGIIKVEAGGRKGAWNRVA